METPIGFSAAKQVGTAQYYLFSVQNGWVFRKILKHHLYCYRFVQFNNYKYKTYKKITFICIVVYFIVRIYFYTII